MDEPRHWHLGWKHKRGCIAATERECRSSLRCAPFFGDLCSLHWPGDAKPNSAKQHENNMRFSLVFEVPWFLFPMFSVGACSTKDITNRFRRSWAM